VSAKSSRGGYEPSWTEVTIGALLSVLIGAVLAVVFLVLKPVIIVKDEPKDDERDRSSVYFIEGSRDPAKAKLASAKRKSFVAGDSVVVDENELNSFIAPAAGAPVKPADPLPAAKPAPGAKAAPPAKAPPPAAPETKPGAPAPIPSGLRYVAGVPNFRINDSALQLAVPTKIYVFGLELNVIVQGRGTFVKSGENFVYDPTTLLVGSCPVDRLPMARNFVVKKIFEAQPVPEDIIKAWSTLSDVAVVGTALKLTMP
jgi:hypothetical protein